MKKSIRELLIDDLFLSLWLGLEVAFNRPTSSEERVLIAPKRDFTLKPDYEFLREELDKGRNTLASVISFATCFLSFSLKT